MSEEKDNGRQFYNFVVEQIKQGKSRYEMTKMIVSDDLDEAAAQNLIDETYRIIANDVREEQFTTSAIIPATIAGAGAAILCGGIWGLISYYTGYEIGYLAWGVGLVTGVTVVLVTKGKKGLPIQFITVLFCILGIMLGKYISFYSFLKDMIAEKYGEEVLAQISILSPASMQIFAENFTDMLKPMTFLWFFLAISTAWSMTKSMGIHESSLEPLPEPEPVPIDEMMAEPETVVPEN